MAADVAVIAALVASVGFGVNAVVVQLGMARIGSPGNLSPAFAASFIITATSVVFFWLLVLASGGLPELSARLLAPFIITGIFYPAAFRFLYYKGIDRIGASVAGTAVAANPAVAAVLAVAVLGEAVTPSLGLGLVCIIAGGSLLQIAKQRGDTGSGATDVIVEELKSASAWDLVYPLGAMTAAGAGAVVISAGLNAFPHPVVATAVTQTTALSVFLWAILSSKTLQQDVKTCVQHRAVTVLFIFAGALLTVAWLSQFVALQTGEVVVVIPLVNTNPLVIVVLTYALARQFPRSPRVIAGIVTLVFGATLIQAF